MSKFKRGKSKADFTAALLHGRELKRVKSEGAASELSQPPESVHSVRSLEPLPESASDAADSAEEIYPARKTSRSRGMPIPRLGRARTMQTRL